MELDEGMSDEQSRSKNIVVVGEDGSRVEVPQATGDEEKNPVEMVEQPAKVMRIGSMVKQLLEEVRAAPLDDSARGRLADIYRSSIKELERLTLPFTDGTPPSDAELRIAQAQLVGWLEGLFHGIQTALFAQQMAARVQLEQMRGAQGHPALPPGALPQAATGGTGQYL
jgi:hypothetical protein